MGRSARGARVMANGTLAASQLEMLSQSGTGIMTIVPPATNTNQTLTLPDRSGTVATTDSTGDAPMYSARAWVNFNGTGTVAIRASGNVSSITDNGTGDYTINFTTAMQDTNYAFCDGLGAGSSDTQVGAAESSLTARTTSLFRIYTGNGTSTKTDFPTVMLSVFR